MFGGEICVNLGFGVGIKFRDAAGDLVAIDILFGGFDEGIDITNFGFDFGMVGVLLSIGEAISGSGTLEITEGIGEGVIAAAQNPVDDFAFGHGVEVVDTDEIFGNHCIQDVGDELEAGAASRFVVVGAEREVAGGEFGGEFGILETEFIEARFVAENGDIIIKAFDFGESPGVIEEVAVAEGILEAIGGEAGDFVVGDGEEFVIGNFAGEDAVFFELAGDDAGTSDDFTGAGFDGLLVLGIAIEIVDSVFETGAGDIVEKAGEGLNLVVGEVPDDEGGADTMSEDRAEILVIIDGAIIHGGHADVSQALKFGGSDVLEKPSGEVGGENFEVFT